MIIRNATLSTGNMVSIRAQSTFIVENLIS